MNIDHLVVADKSLKPRISCILYFLAKKMRTSGLDYVDTSLAEIQKITKHATKGATCKAVNALANGGYIVKELYKNPGARGWKHLRISFGNRLTAALKSQRVVSPKRFPKSETIKDSNNKNYNNLNYININQSSQDHLKGNSSAVVGSKTEHTAPINTTVQDMIAVATRVLGKPIRLNKRLAAFLYKAYTSVFKSLERWERYLRWRCYCPSKIKYAAAFLFSILDFSQINAIPEEVMNTVVEEVREVWDEDQARAHIDASRESESCIKFREWFLNRRGSAAYCCWLAPLTFREEDGEIVIDSAPSKFLKDWVQQQHLDGFNWERRSGQLPPPDEQNCDESNQRIDLQGFESTSVKHDSPRAPVGEDLSRLKEFYVKKLTTDANALSSSTSRNESLDHEEPPSAYTTAEFLTPPGVLEGGQPPKSVRANFPLRMRENQTLFCGYLPVGQLSSIITANLCTLKRT